MKRSIVLLGLRAVGDASVPARADVEVVSTFEGNRGPGWKAAANVMGAVGPRHVVDFTEGGFTMHAATNFSNYSATCIDPSAGDLLWTYQGCANSTVDRQWCTAWAAFKWIHKEQSR